LIEKNKKQLPLKPMKDRLLHNLLLKESKRQEETLDLIPSENVASLEVLHALATPLVNKYSEGYPGKRYYAGNGVIDEIEILAQERARKAFHLTKNWHVNVQAYSGSPANQAIYYALLKPGEKIMGMSLPSGGHLTHGAKYTSSSRFYTSAPYEVERDGLIDYEKIKKLAHKEKPQIIVAGATAYPRTLDFKKFGAIAKEVGAYFLADISHIAGLVVAGSHPSPFPYADAVMTTTHKSLRGPRGALIFVNTKSRIAKEKEIDIASKIDKAILPGLQGGPHNNQTAAIAVALFEAATPAFKKYGHQIIKNAHALAHGLKKNGFTLVTDGTDNHLMLVDLTNLGLSGRAAQDTLEESGIIVNRNAIPYDVRSPFDPSGIRIGTPALTSRGMKEKEMALIADFFSAVLKDNKNVKNEVKKLCKKFPLPY
jgi:glycine hydroxymethyltransferase